MSMARWYKRWSYTRGAFDDAKEVCKLYIQGFDSLGEAKPNVVYMCNEEDDDINGITRFLHKRNEVYGKSV